MTMSLSRLVRLLENDIPQIAETPNRVQAEQAIKDAVEDFSMRCPMRKIASIEVVRGQASYALPTDFLRFIKLMPAPHSRPMVQGDRLVLHPIPDYSGQRELHYAARYIRDADQVYPDLTEAIAPIVLLKAKAILTNLLANSTGGDGWKYKIGDEEVDKSNQGGNLRKNANHFHEVYMEAVTRHIGYVTLR